MYRIIMNKYKGVAEDGTPTTETTYSVYDSIKKRTLATYNTYSEAYAYLRTVNKS